LTLGSGSDSLSPLHNPMNASSLKIMQSILAADMAYLADDCQRAITAGVEGLHVDVMDGHFVPNLSMGPAVVASLRKSLGDAIPLHVHLMIMRPDTYAEAFIDAGADTVLIHVESPCDVSDTLQRIRARGKTAGITLNPDTPASDAQPFLERGEVDEVLCMTVHPGFGGQAFIREVLPKIAALRAMAPTLDISVDGGIDLQTAPACAEAGANIMLAGTALFGAPDMAVAIQQMRRDCASALERGASA
jgi:ribulose-phosphate 3-epimerase